jgi:hypothetical protein
MIGHGKTLDDLGIGDHDGTVADLRESVVLHPTARNLPPAESRCGVHLVGGQIPHEGVCPADAPRDLRPSYRHDLGFGNRVRHLLDRGAVQPVAGLVDLN